ncbi:hypothetical protein [Streptomyces ureilyticus]|uniref:Uncharacterized protein n=1 Tax=Streptomyces ureilyticus TaxID=1775131 RepID=A0ABX0E483_9ACTN|nr:hypothetical protein [Streptomyces ureilyticus]NGO48195.1 hypothetical protein [Streptomyces ureilyticus]
MATATANIPAHLAHWFLIREQFEPVPDTPGLYRLTHPEQDGIRRTRQAVHDLRRHGYEVQADYALDPTRTPGPPKPAARNGLRDRRTRIAQAAATRSPQRPSVVAATPGRPMPQPAADHAPAAGNGRGR